MGADVTSRLVREVLLALPLEERPIQYLILGGNAGDALIDLGFFTVAGEENLPYTLLRSPDEIDENSCVVVGGGGGLVTEWSGSRRVIGDLLQRRAKRLVILPQTIRSNEELLAAMGPNVTLFTRELTSFSHAQEHATGGARVLVDHDMAFNVDARNLLDRRPPRLPRPRSAKDLARVGLYGAAAVRSRVLNRIDVRRRDIERVSQRAPVRLHNDLSFVSTFRGHDGEAIENMAGLLLALIDRYAELRTDRLHVGIGAHLLGKRVTLVNNSNSKVRAVYDYSLSWCDNVRFDHD